MNLKSIAFCALLILAFIGPAFGQTNTTDWFAEGMSLYNQDRFEESVQAYDKALQNDPQDAEAWNNKGISLGILGRYSEALVAFKKAVEINSSYAEAWYNMGVIFDFQERYVEAIQAYNMATQINPSYQKAWFKKNEDINIIGLANYLQLNKPPL